MVRQQEGDDEGNEDDQMARREDGVEERSKRKNKGKSSVLLNVLSASACL